MLAACGSSSASRAAPSATTVPPPGGSATVIPAGTITADPTRTPGVTNPQATAATIATTICKAGWTATVRPSVSYTNNLKLRQLLADPRYTNHNPADYEEDHFIPLELGGDPHDPGNLWPEPHPRSGRTDVDENRLHAAVCAGKITLADGQAQIMAIKRTLG